MITIKQGSIFDCREDIIVHQVNCRGVMGAGLAKDIKKNFPHAAQIYEKYCELQKDRPEMLLGRCVMFYDNGKQIAHVFGQLDYGRGGKVYTNYAALQIGLEKVAKIARIGYSVAIPYGIGCGLGGGDWNNVVYPMILDVFKDVENVVIYQLN